MKEPPTIGGLFLYKTLKKLFLNKKMTIVAPGSSFTARFITNDDVETLGQCILLNKNTNVSTTLTAGSTVVYYDSDYYTEADITATVAEGEFYQYTVYDDQGTLVYTGSVFCTAQSTYSINNGVYTQNSTTNEYITR